jgi:hypothetical protein
MDPPQGFPTRINPDVAFKPDFAFGCTHKCFMHLKVALNIALLVVMELFLNRSVKSLNLAALKDRDNQHSIKAARLRLLTDLIKKIP